MKIICALILLGLLAATPVSDARAQDAAATEMPPPMLELEIAGKKFWLAPKNDALRKLGKDEKRFVERFVKALQLGSLPLLSDLVWPDSLKCLRSAPPELRNAALDSLVADPMKGEGYSLVFESFVQDFEPEFAKQLGEWNKDPVMHTHTFLFGYHTKGGASTTRNFKLVKQKSDYYIVLGCPTPQSVKRLVDTQEMAKEMEKKLAAALAVLTVDQLNTLYDIASKGGVQPAAEEYERMHPQFTGFGYAVASTLRNKFIASEKEKAKESALKQRAEIEAAKANPDPSATIDPAATTPAVQATDSQPEESRLGSGNLIKLASLLALIFAVAVLLLRVLRRDDSHL